MASVLHYKAVLFDLDGVVTDTARVHAAAWKALFDEFLFHWYKGKGNTSPFDLEQDYLTYVDGKTRYDGVTSFLQSRGVSLPFGQPNDAPTVETICGLGNRKDLIFIDVLKSKGVDVFESSRRLILELKAKGVRCGVVSSSKNCQRVLQAAGVEDLFDVRVDGAIAASLGLKGKPAPDMFLRGADLLKISPAVSVVVEDSVSGVQSAFRGGFGLIVGVDRAGNRDLGGEGAHVIVSDLQETNVFSLDKEFCERVRGVG